MFPSGPWHLKQQIDLCGLMIFVLLLLLQRFDEAANSFYEGVKLDPENKELVYAFR